MNSTPVNPHDYEAPGTTLHTVIGWVVLVIAAPVIFLVSLMVSYGLAIFAWIWWPIHTLGNIKKAHAQLRGSALHLSPVQMPELYDIAHQYAARLGMKECPEIYLIEDNQQNAFAMKFGSRQAIVLIDDIVYGAIHAGNMGALNFIIAHELAHHALGHTGFFRKMISVRNKHLGRLDEFSCDAVANALVGDIGAAQDAFCLLLVGPQLFATVNRDGLDAQALEVVQNKHSKKSEKPLTHPLLLRRYAALVHKSPV